MILVKWKQLQKPRIKKKKKQTKPSEPIIIPEIIA